jgi:hypothetical protein
MSFLPPVESGSSTPKELLPAATHEAYCYGVVDAGTQERKPYMGKPKTPARQIILFFEFPDIRARFKEDGPEEPRVKNQKFAYFTDEKSSLAKLCKSWLGKKVQDVEFDKLAGTPASITISHDVSETNGKTYDNISSIAPLSTKLIPLMTPQYNENMNFSIMQDGFDSPKFDKLYEWVKEMIMESAEYKEYLAGPKASQTDCPFNE